MASPDMGHRPENTAFRKALRVAATTKYSDRENLTCKVCKARGTGNNDHRPKPDIYGEIYKSPTNQGAKPLAWHRLRFRVGNPSPGSATVFQERQPELHHRPQVDSARS